MSNYKHMDEHGFCAPPLPPIHPPYPTPLSFSLTHAHGHTHTHTHTHTLTSSLIHLHSKQTTERVRCLWKVPLEWQLLQQSRETKFFQKVGSHSAQTGSVKQREICTVLMQERKFAARRYQSIFDSCLTMKPGTDQKPKNHQSCSMNYDKELKSDSFLAYIFTETINPWRRR